jgi:pepF/M3 family oligoendopeptidase
MVGPYVVVTTPTTDTPIEDDAALPRWDPTDVFPGLESRELASAREEVTAELVRLVAQYDEHGVGECEPHPPSVEEVDAFDAILDATNAVEKEHAVTSAFVASYLTTDSRNDLAQSLYSTLERDTATLRQLSARLAAWVAALGPDALAAASPLAADHVFPLERATARAAHQMPGPEEQLYAELAVTGSSAWSRLQRDVTSQLTAPVVFPGGQVETLPITAVRGLATSPEPALRRAAYDAELAAWPTVATACAAAMNAIKGEAVTVNARRRWEDPLDASLFANAVDRPTFEAMRAAVDASLDDFRRWLRAKARLHGHGGGLPWWDLFAPLPVAPGAVSWDDGCGRVTDAFGHYSPALRAMAERALRDRWIDAEARDGKQGGAFCMPFTGDRSLVLLNWSASFDSVQTLAHELGHAYHNTQLAERTPMQRRLPMALAETASIFCETLVVSAGLASATGTERLALLDTDLQGAAQVVVDIHSRLLFETEVFRRRRDRTLSPRELCELMTTAQREAYGDGLDGGTLHPYMWALKPHYYGSHFYNWPYTYGLLFGLGLYAEYQRDPERFRQGYDDLLSAVGLADAATLGRRFGIDVRDEAFWTASLDVLRARMGDYERLAESIVAPPAGSP